MAGTLYTYPDSFRAAKILIAAEYSGANINVVSEPPQFVLGETNKTNEFLVNFPLGKVPAFLTPEGKPIYESNAIAFYVSSGQLRGTSDLDATYVQQYINLADNEILPSVCTWTFPTLGLMQYNKANTEQAQTKIKTVLGVLEGALATRTFLVGERVTLADITCVCNLLLLYKQVLEPGLRAPYVNVNRWFMTCINQPQFKAVLGDIELCTKTATFDAQMYNKLFPKKQKKKEEKPQSPVVKQTKKAAPPSKSEEKEEEEEDVPKPPKFIDPYVDLPKSTFVLDAFKRSYSNEDTATKAVPFFWDNFDKEGWSIWKAVYEDTDTLNEKKVFMLSNLVSGMFQRLDKLRKYAFGSVLVLGKEKDFAIEGVWILRGQELAFDLVSDWNIDAPSYKFTKLDPDSEADRATCNKYLLWEGDFGGKEVADGKIYK